MKKRLIFILFISSLEVFAQNDTCSYKLQKVKVKVIVIDKTNAIETSNTNDKYELILIDILFSKTSNAKRIVARNFFNKDFKEGKVYNIKLEKLNPNCWPIFSSDFLTEKNDEVYRIW